MNAFIWDLDGTLLDSYGVIVSGTVDACLSFGLAVKKEEAHRQAIQHSVNWYLQTVSRDFGLPFEEVQARYSEISGQRKGDIHLLPYARAVLDGLKEQGVCHFVYTHRGKTTDAVLKNLGLNDCFTEIVTSQNGFSRKPVPDAILYLMDKYGLAPETTFYVGDRTIDMDCARNAGIRGILFLPEGNYCVPNGAESRIIRDLRDLL
ncbi:MAG: HAD-IA family hydrolase [Clostridia bacterium]|nr:HAD-IA family hydrolase [Clostridia bacterium]